VLFKVSVRADLSQARQFQDAAPCHRPADWSGLRSSTCRLCPLFGQASKQSTRPLFIFTGVWTEFSGDRGTKSKPLPRSHLVYGILTSSPNAVVEPIRSKAMPVILTTQKEREVWMRALGRGRRRCNGP
jgi:hypothetical protein